MHRSLSIELDLSSPTKRFSLAGLEFHSGNRPRSGRRPPDFAPSSETLGGYVGQDFRRAQSSRCPRGGLGPVAGGESL